MANGEAKALMRTLTTYGSFFAAILIIVGGIQFMSGLQRGQDALANEHKTVQETHNAQVVALRNIVQELKSNGSENDHAHERILEHQTKNTQMLDGIAKSLDRSNILMDQITRRLERMDK